MSNQLQYYLAFSHCLGVGPVRFGALVSHFKTVQEAYGADIREIEKLVGPAAAAAFQTFRSTFDPEKKLKELKEKGIQIVSRDDKNYPQALKEIPDSPICLYVKGDLENYNVENDFFFGVVGTRQPTPYGEKIARTFSHELAEMGIVIVSGMAYGIDAAAHWGALYAKGRTIAILGCGVDIPHPPSNRNLYEEILGGGGLVVSEFPPGHTVRKGLFVARNRLISGLSRGVLIVEGAKDSGALITARYAANQGKEVFAPPSPITSDMSFAPNFLLKEGAKLVTSVEDILEEFQIKRKGEKRGDVGEDFTESQKKIFDILSNEPKLIDELVLEAKITVSEVSQIISKLELLGYVEKNSEGRYQRS
ncbi:DNA-protecting protein DprA [Candidatus Roizmanbacteria bacterium]|nr:DNA-protecting protein DprA [Candidatus Roizmanbacteria bacterium]